MQGRYAPHILEKQMVFLRCLLTAVPAAVAISIAILLASSAQLHEVLLRAFEGTLVRDIAGLGVFTMLCMLLGTWDYQLTSSFKDAEYPKHANPYLDRLLARLIAAKSALITAIPFIGLIIGLYWAWKLQAPEDLGVLDRADLEAFKGQVLKNADPGHFRSLILVTLGLMVLSVIAIAVVHRTRIRLLIVLVVVTVALGSFSIISGWFAPGLLSDLASEAGSFSVLSLITMGLVTLIFCLTFLAQNRISIIAVFVGVLLVVTAFGLTRTPQSRIAGSATAAAGGGGVAAVGAAAVDNEIFDLETAFKAWAAKRNFGRGSRPDPVFIFALPGGGIYAASAGATMLAALQDRCTNFARHVFAVSAVSGGAVGATIFNTVLAALPEPNRKNCETLEARSNEQHTALIRSVILPDHLAPVGAFVLPDILRKIPGLIGVPIFSSNIDRAQALEISVRKALLGLETRPGNIVMPKELVEQNYLAHWKPDGRVPALLLNTTWVETGSRVAFAPFKLKQVGGGNLYSFADDLFQHSSRVKDTKTLQAGVVSARFPLTSPAWQLDDVKVPAIDDKTGKTQLETRTWNFVDGGYADNSGMLTAHDIYKKLAKIIKDQKLKIDLRLVALGDDPLEELPDGTTYTDTVAPLSALLNLRRRGLVEVVREITEIDPHELKRADELNKLLSARAGANSPLLVFRLNRSRFPLTLGWTISKYRNSTIRLQLGEPELCSTLAVQKDRAADVILANSCVQREILGLLGARWPQPADPRVPGGG